MNSLDQILSDITIYLHPKYLKLDYKDKIDTKNLDKKKLEEYYQLLTSVNFIFKKIMKYELYFSEFYPAIDKIRKTEALEHHIHAYLEDLDILKNKVCHFLGKLKNDLKRVAINKDEIDDALKQFIEKVLGVFNNVSKHRNPHHHKGMKFLDGNLVDSDLAHTMLQDNNPLRDQFKPEFLEKLKRKEAESFEKARSNWVALAQKNNEQISGFINETFKRNKEFKDGTNTISE
jgi:hypothetical protein